MSSIILPAKSECRANTRADERWSELTFDATTILDLALRCQATTHFALYARAENLLDEDFEEVFGFPALGRFIGAGVTARF